MAIKKVYWTYRHKWTNEWVRYTPSYFLDKQFKDYLDAWLTKVLDNEIPESRYTAEIAPWIKKQTRFIIWEYNEDYIDPDEFKTSIQNVWAEFNIYMFNTALDAVNWLKANTDLKYIEDIKDKNWNVIWWRFEIYPEHQDEISWETISAKYLEII